MFVPRIFPLPSRASLAAVATALLWWVSLQKVGVFAFGWIAFVPLLATLNHIPQTRARFWFGWRTGVLCFALINWWLVPTLVKSVVVIGASPPVGAALGVLSIGLIVVIHGLMLALAALLWNPRAKYFARFPLLLPFAVALLWFGLEWLRASGVLAHSWGALAFSQWSDVALLQSASFLGQHGLSALCVWFAASFALWLNREHSSRLSVLWRVPVAVFLLLHVWGAWRIWDFDRKPPLAQRNKGFSVFVVPTHASSLRKSESFQPGKLPLSDPRNLLSRNDSAFEWAAKRSFACGTDCGAELIVWPETTLSSGATREGPEQKRVVAQLTRDLNISLLAGVQHWSENGELTNQATLFAPDGSQQSRGKVRLVPFGERAPFAQYFPLLARLAPEPPVTPAREIAPITFKTRDGRSRTLGTLICFESCFSQPAKQLVSQGAEMLFVLTNDEWFAGTTAPWEHAAMSTLRAVENGVPVAQCANGGYSVIVDPCGRIISYTGGIFNPFHLNIGVFNFG
jgi:apolipoprotein N-acyltransferase